MNQLIKAVNSVLSMSSRDIAEVTKKDHSNVKRDIASMVLQLNYPDKKLKDCPDFNHSELKGHNITVGLYDHFGNTYSEYFLDYEMTMLLVSGYSVVLRHSILKRWQELESQQAPKLPQSFAEALQLAANQAKQIEEQQQAIELAAPKVEFVDRYVDSKGSKGFRQVAKLLNANENEFRAFLTEQKIMYKLSGEWTPYENHVDAGRFETKTGTANEHAYNQSRFTPKGVQWVAGLWIAFKEFGNAGK
jgi:phage antirepressor YoqD-like protein